MGALGPASQVGQLEGAYAMLQREPCWCVARPFFSGIHTLTIEESHVASSINRFENNKVK